MVKSSKFCNLRCRYCYEFPELGLRESIAQEDLSRMFRHIRDYVRLRDRVDGARTAVDFIWHGGEPLLLPPDYYRTAIGELRDLFDDVPVRNMVQTNLTKLDDDRIALLRSHFDGLGVSIDLFGGLRVNVAGRDSQDTVLRNMSVLRREGIPFGCITVLTSLNVDKIDEIFRYYEREEVPFRVLPLFDGAFETQHDSYELSNGRLVAALCRLFDLWLASPSTVSVVPLKDYLGVALRYVGGAADIYHDRRSWLPVILVNTTGDCYAFGDEFGAPEASLGNVFRTPLRELVRGPRFDLSALAAERRIAANCLHCEFFGACTGSFVADGETSQRDTLDAGMRVCTVERSVISHIVRRISQIPDVASAYRRYRTAAPDQGIEGVESSP